jgi:hypothetical protein
MIDGNGVPGWAEYLNEKALYVKNQEAKQRHNTHRLNGPLPSSDVLATALDVHSWAALEIEPEPCFLGELITPSSRMFLVGRTGLGKTLLAHAMAAGMASGQGFLH